MGDLVHFATNEHGADSSGFNGFPIQVPVAVITGLPFRFTQNELARAYWRTKKWGSVGPSVAVTLTAANITGTSTGGVNSNGTLVFLNGSTTRTMNDDSNYQNANGWGTAVGCNSASYHEWYGVQGAAPVEEGYPDGNWMDSLAFYGYCAIQFAFVAKNDFDPTAFDKNSFVGQGFDLYYNIVAGLVCESAYQMSVLSTPSWTKCENIESGVVSGTANAIGTVRAGTELLSCNGSATASYELVTDVDSPVLLTDTSYGNNNPDPAAEARLGYTESTARPDGDSEKDVCKGNVLFPSINRNSDGSIFAIPNVSTFTNATLLHVGSVLGVTSSGTGLVGLHVLQSDGWIGGIAWGLAFPSEYWPYKNRSGSPVWDAATGRRIAPVS